MLHRTASPGGEEVAGRVRKSTFKKAASLSSSRSLGAGVEDSGPDLLELLSHAAVHAAANNRTV